MTITLTLTETQWVELVHALCTKIEYVQSLWHDIPTNYKKPWLRLLNRLYNKVQKIVEEKGIEC